MATAIDSDIEPPVLGDAPTKPPKNQFILRPMQWSDISTLANHTVDAYDPDPVTAFLSPERYKYRNDIVRHNIHNILSRMVNVRELSVVACEASNPTYPIGYGQFIRLNQSHWHFIKYHGPFKWHLLTILTFLVSWYIWVENRLWPIQGFDPTARKIFSNSNAADQKRYWLSHPERANRWQAQSIIVAPEFQGKGVGRLVTLAGLEQAQEENVIMGIQASPAGERLYSKLGFKMLGDYTYRVEGQVGGGIMIWYPKTGEGVKSK